MDLIPHLLTGMLNALSYANPAYFNRAERET